MELPLFEVSQRLAGLVDPEGADCSDIVDNPQCRGSGKCGDGGQLLWIGTRRGRASSGITCSR